MDISQVQTQQISTQANQAATREREVTAARSVSPELTETQQYEARQKYDTLELSDEGRASLNNSQMQNADTKSLAMSGVDQQQKQQEAEPEVKEAQKMPVEQTTTTKSAPVEDLSSYSKTELKQLLNTGAISRAEYDAEIESREGNDKDTNNDKNDKSVDNANSNNSKTLGTNGKDDNSLGFGQEKK